jgi:hypothetical protein
MDIVQRFGFFMESILSIMQYFSFRPANLLSMKFFHHSGRPAITMDFISSVTFRTVLSNVHFFVEH